MRMFMTNFADTAVLRFATMQLVRGSWIAFNSEKNPANVIADQSLVNPPLDNSTIDIQAVNVFEDAKRDPIPYVVPPGIKQQPDYSNLQTTTKLNEQSLSMVVNNLSDGYSRAAYRLFNNDMRKYKQLQMFVHTEGAQLKNNDISAFLRLGSDYTENYYEYEIPLQVTQPHTADPSAIWPAANEIDLQLSLLTSAKLARNNAKYQGQPWPLTLPYTMVQGHNKITIVGQPDLSKVANIMLGVRNPLRTAASSGTDDGLAKSGIVWFDEMRLSDFNESGGWAATGRANIKLADFANISVSGSTSSIGFGTLDSRLADRALSSSSIYDVSGSVELGKFFPEKSGIHIPAYIDISSQVNTPEYDPTSPDILLKQSLSAASTAEKRDSIKTVAEDFTMRKSFNVTNVHKSKTDPKAISHFYDIENWNATVAYTEYEHHDFTTVKEAQKTYHVSLAYNFTNQPKYYSPFSKIIKNNMLALIKDINYSLVPSRLNFSILFDRNYSENTLRNNDPNAIIPIPTSFNKTFNITRVYGIGWNLSKSLSMDIDATNLSTVDEPAGRLTGLKVDTLWKNIFHLGRTTNYNHTLNFNYTAPLSKIPGLDWTNLTAHYSTHFNWQGQPLFAINNPTYDVGNSIQNSRTIQLNPALNLESLYRKFGFIKRLSANDSVTSVGKVLVGLLTSIKNVSGNYTRTQGTFIPGYLPQSNLLGQDFNYGSPGVGFLLGSQADLRQTAIARGWISTDSLQNQQYVTTYNEDLHLKATIQPFKDLRIELNAFKTQDHTYQTTFKSIDGSDNIQNLNPVTNGNYSVSYMTIATAFSKISGVDNSSPLFQKFLDNRTIISQRLGKSNPNSTGASANGYTDGYSANSQNVLVPAFLAALTGKDANSVSLGQFPSTPIPNWQITYNGLSHMAFFADLFESVDISNGYRSSFNVSGYTTLLQYQTANGAVSSKDANNDFLPFKQFSTVTIFEQFEPLIGINARFKNSMTGTLEYRQSRSLSLSLLNSQLAQQNMNVFVIGWGYHTKTFRFPFGWFAETQNRNDVNFKIDFSLQDNKTLIYQADVKAAQVSSGSQNITVRPSIDYMISQRFNLNLFYDSNITRPYTSQTFNTAFTNFGINMKLILQ